MKRKVSLTLERFQASRGDVAMLDVAKSIDVDAVDFSLIEHDYRKEGDIYSKSDAEIVAHMNEVRERAAELGIEIGQTHGRIVGFCGDKEKDAATLRNARLDCLATSALGAKYCVMHTVTSMVFGKNADPDVMRRINFDMFTQILPYAKEFDVKVATETYGDAPGIGCIEFFGDMNEFIRGYDMISEASEYADHFCVCMDTGHTHRSVRFGCPSVAECIKMLGDRIEVLHLNDNDGVFDQHKIPMTGTINWKDTFDALDEIGYHGNYNMELDMQCFGAGFEYEEAEFAVRAMRHILKKRYGD